MRNILDRFFYSRRGTITAEFAVLMPAVIVILAIIINAAAIGIQQVRMQEAAAAAARQLARGDERRTVQATVNTMSGEATAVSLNESAGWAHVVLSRPAPGPIGWMDFWDLKAEAQAPAQWVMEP